jgi:hypothetical protein
MKPRNILKKGGIRSLLLRPPSMQGATFIRPLHHHKSLHVTMPAERG